MDRRKSLLGALPPLVLAACGDPSSWEHGPVSRETAPAEILTERLRTGAIQGADRSGDVRPEAIAILEAAAAADPEPLSLADVRDEGLAPMAALAFEPPETIRVWRRSLDGSSDSCSGRVDEIPFEQYVRGVLPHEWIPSWHEESLKAGAVAIRTYAAFLVETGGRYDCAHVDDTTSTQVYEDEFLAATDAAVEATAGIYVVDENGDLVLAEYSAENGDPTEFGVDEPLCSGEEVFGHGRGTCQWGTQRWALEGRAFDEIVTHYYPGSSLKETRSQLGAALVRRDAPAQLVAGEAGTAEIALENTAVETWTPGATFLATSPSGRTSELYDEATWESGQRVAAVAYDVASGEVASLSFALRAPEVTEAVVYEESFRLTHEGAPFGPAITLAVEVVPGSGGGSAGGGGTSPATGTAQPPNVFGCRAVAGSRGPFALAPLCAILLLSGFISRRRRSPAE